MKKQLLLGALMLLTATAQVAAENPGKITSRQVAIQPFDKLSIAANVLVILYESPVTSTILIKGKENYTRRIAVLQKDGKLLITSNSDADMKEQVTVFIPVNQLKVLEVKGDAVIRSQTILQSPDLHVETEGLCEIYILVNGTVNVKKGNNYTSVRRIRPENAMMRLAMPVNY